MPNSINSLKYYETNIILNIRQFLRNFAFFKIFLNQSKNYFIRQRNNFPSPLTSLPPLRIYNFEWTSQSALIFQVVNARNARGKCRWHVVDARFGNVAGGNVEWGNSRVASHGHEPEVPLTRGDSLLDACTLDFPEAG